MADATADASRVPLADIPSALDSFDALSAAIGGRRPALFLDYDGTLTPIVDRPEMAILSDDGRAVVDAIAKKLPVAVVSGRDRPDVEKLVGIASLTYAGSHGFDINVAPGQALDRSVTAHSVGEEFIPILDKAEAALSDGLRPVEGSLVERKKFSIALHYRLVADDAYPVFRDVLDRVLGDFPDLKEKTGKKVFEFQPRIDWDKGKAVLYLLKALKLDGNDVCPMFFGDDVTDEDAFQVLQAGGIGVISASPAEVDRTTFARFRVDDPDQVLELLRRLTP